MTNHSTESVESRIVNRLQGFTKDLKQMLEFHEAANIFPMDEENIGDLADDIKKNGQQIPIELLDGKVLDGRRRYKACQIVQVDPVFKSVDIDDPVAYVLSLNLHRRHLTPSQLSMCAARAKGIYDKAAAARRAATLKQNADTDSANLHERKAEHGRSSYQAAKAFSVGGRSVDYASKVLEKGTPEDIKNVDEGRVSVSAAARKLTAPTSIPQAPLEKFSPQHEHVEQPASSGDNSQPIQLSKPIPAKQVIVAPVQPPQAPMPSDQEEADHTKSELFAMNKARVAITQLTSIPRDNEYRQAALDHVLGWISEEGSK